MAALWYVAAWKGNPMADTCTLVNKKRGLMVLNLYHGDVPELAKMGVVGTRGYDPETGKRPVLAHKRPISGSVTLLAKGDPGGGDCVSGLPRSIRASADVKAAVARGDVEVRDDEETETATPEPLAARASTTKKAAPSAPSKLLKGDEE